VCEFSKQEEEMQVKHSEIDLRCIMKRKNSAAGENS